MFSGEKTDVELSRELPLRSRAFRLLLITQGVFFTLLTWCILRAHDFAARSAGISYYGAHHQFVLVAVVGYGVAAIGLWRVATLFKRGGVHPLVCLGMRTVAVMLILLLLTPYNEGAVLNWTHMSVGVCGALVQLAIAIALIKRVGTRAAIGGFAVQLFGGVVGAFSLPDWRFQVLLYSEMIFELGFGWGLLEWTKVLSEESTA